jgi:stearoyl-CoA desaturase (delta-9 desaturase)
MLLDKIKNTCTSKKEELEKAVHEMADQIVAKIADFNRLKAEYLEKKKEQSCRDLVKSLRREIRQLKRSLRQDWRQWVNLSRDIMRLQPLAA